MFEFIKEYLKHFRSVGAVAPSSHRLACKMMCPIDFENAECIVEYGSGTGSFTKELIARRNENTVLVLIEQNQNFYNILRKKFKGLKNIYFVHGSAEHTVQILKKLNIKKADYIVSGLPFTSLPKKISLRIFRATDKLMEMNPECKFITFQYTLVKKKFFGKYFRFDDIIREYINLPPAYVFVLKRKI